MNPTNPVMPPLSHLQHKADNFCPAHLLVVLGISHKVHQEALYLAFNINAHMCGNIQDTLPQYIYKVVSLAIRRTSAMAASVH